MITARVSEVAMAAALRKRCRYRPARAGALEPARPARSAGVGRVPGRFQPWMAFARARCSAGGQPAGEARRVGADTTLRAVPQAASLGRSARGVSTRHRTLRTHLKVHDTL